MKEPGIIYPRRIIRLLILLCGAGLLFSALLLFSDSREYAAGEAAYEEMRLLGAAPSRNQQTDKGGEGQPEKIIDFPSLAEINEDITGWLFAPKQGIDYPVVQGGDNDFYLRRLFTGESNKLGSIFMDYRNQRDFSDKNTLIYGHNMRDGSMFAALTKYQDQSYYEEFPAMELYTPGGNFALHWFAGMVVDGDYESVRRDFENEEDFLRYTEELQEASDFTAPILIEGGERIITLCTCSYQYNNARYALFGKLIPRPAAAEGE